NEVIRKISKGKEKMRKTQKKLYKTHMARVKKKDCNAELTVDYAQILHSLDRITDNCAGISEEAMDNLSFVNLRDEAQSVKENISGGSECKNV
ncbi:MAG: PhoU domain-containing protein, partial [Oscillospiraceae bacterium]